MRVGDIVFFGWVHVVPTIVALIAGAWNLCLPKGTALHRKVGLAYVWSMIAASVSSASPTMRMTGAGTSTSTPPPLPYAVQITAPERRVVPNTTRTTDRVN